MLRSAREYSSNHAGRSQIGAIIRLLHDFDAVANCWFGGWRAFASSAAATSSASASATATLFIAAAARSIWMPLRRIEFRNDKRNALNAIIYCIRGRH
jgi:hypothetical protein